MTEWMVCSGNQLMPHNLCYVPSAWTVEQKYLHDALLNKEKKINFYF